MGDKRNYAQNIVPADLTAYIYKSRLEKLLQEMFGENIKVNAPQHKADRFEFFAPRMVTDVGIHPSLWLSSLTQTQDDLMYG
ncbi:uncharacterized protein BDW70DRAFT_159953 [Aspergillus foveolatus]|uniref:uncharacterized protein n=1 Tax=Aspergillus foveolatus TaxID=210207 RepID=UPI003CCCB4C0